MKATTLAWPLFWGAFDKQDPATLYEWLARWGFDDGGATILVSSQATEKGITIEEKRRLPLSFSLVPLLLVEGEVPDEARLALLENRSGDAAELLMKEYGLSCNEAGDLLDISAC